MTSVFDKFDEREGEKDEPATEETDYAAEYCKWQIIPAEGDK